MRARLFRSFTIVCLGFFCLCGCAAEEVGSERRLVGESGAERERTSVARPVTRPGDVVARAAVKPFVLHLPGVSGESVIDHELRAGLRRAGFGGEIEIYDWTCHDPGIPALHARRRNFEQAGIIAERLIRQFHAHPDVPIYLTCHSGGAGPAVWALEQLPADVKVKTFVMIAPALSPEYDLSKALGHVEGRAYNFFSPEDNLVLGTGTRLFGTIDGVRTDAAGRVGFVRPADADEKQYAKLVAKPYETSWARFGHVGGHIGGMTAPFVQAIVGPVMLEKVLLEDELKVIERSVRPVMDVLWPE